MSTTTCTPQSPRATVSNLQPYESEVHKQMDPMDTLQLIMNYVVTKTTDFTAADILSPNKTSNLDMKSIVKQFKNKNYQLCTSIYSNASKAVVRIVNLIHNCAINYLILLRGPLAKEVAHCR
jgi:hypothetical protein